MIDLWFFIKDFCFKDKKKILKNEKETYIKITKWKISKKKSIISSVLKVRYWVAMIDPKKKRLTQKLAI